MKFVIDRSKWRCGDVGEHWVGLGDTRMLNVEGYMCCLGQVARQLGVPDEDLINHGESCDCGQWHSVKVEYDDGDWCTDYVRKDTPEMLAMDEVMHKKVREGVLEYYAIKINDNQNTTPEEKEAALKDLFAEAGHEIEFVGEYVRP